MGEMDKEKNGERKKNAKYHRMPNKKREYSWKNGGKGKEENKIMIFE